MRPEQRRYTESVTEMHEKSDMEEDMHEYLFGKVTLSFLIWTITMATRNIRGDSVLIETIQCKLLMSHRISFLLSSRGVAMYT